MTADLLLLDDVHNGAIHHDERTHRDYAFCDGGRAYPVTPRLAKLAAVGQVMYVRDGDHGRWLVTAIGRRRLEAAR